MKKRQWIIIAVAVGIVFGSIVLAAVFGQMKEPPKKELVTVSKKYVKTEPVVYGDQSTYITAFGRVKSAKTLDIIAEVSGRMFEGGIRLKEGESFKKGNLIYFIDDTEAKFNLNASKSNFLRDLATILPDLKVDFSDNYDTWRAYFQSVDLEAPLPPLPKHRSEKERTFLATKNIYNSYYSIKSTEANLRKYRFYAPFGGSISKTNFESGSFVNPGSNIGTLVMTENLELKVDVNANDIGWIQRGAKAYLSNESNTMKWEGRVLRIGQVVNQQTQSIDVYIQIMQNGLPVFDGNYLRAEIPGQAIEKAMTVSRGALFDGNKVFVLDDSLLKIRQVKVHRLNPETAVLSGLEPGSDLVVEPLVDAHNNMKASKIEEENLFAEEALSKN